MQRHFTAQALGDNLRVGFPSNNIGIQIAVLPWQLFMMEFEIICRFTWQLMMMSCSGLVVSRTELGVCLRYAVVRY